MATGAGNGRNGRNGKEQAAAPAAISEASSDLSDPDLTSAFQPACSIAPRSTRKRMSIVTVKTRSRAIVVSLQHRSENRNPFSMAAKWGACPPKAGALICRIASGRLRPFAWIMTCVKFLVRASYGAGRVTPASNDALSCS